MKNSFKIFFTLLAVFAFDKAMAQSNPEAINLTCEYIQNPLGIAVKHPRLSWNIASLLRNTIQSGYEIIVSDNEERILKCRGTQWQTGLVSSSETIQHSYEGAALQPFTRYYWRVKLYDGNGRASAWSAVAAFETAMLSPSDWKAQWISDGSKNPEHDEDYYKPDRMPLLRKEFIAEKKIQSAWLYICGVGYYEAYINGKKVGDHVLDPGFTTYRKQVQYVVHDVTSLLTRRKNVLGVMPGSGWWNPLPLRFFGRWDLRSYQQTGRPCVKAELHMAYSDGTKGLIVTDESWQWAPGPVVQNSVYLGEKYDARLEQKEWNTIQADTSLWKKAAIAEGPSGLLTPQMQPPIRVTKVIKPVRILTAGKDTFIADMGQNFAGVARIKVRGRAGTKITLRYGEALMKDGSLNFYTSAMTQIKKGVIRGGPGAPETAWQEDSYTLKGEGEEQWSPRFTFHGFRYVEVTGWPGTPALAAIEGLRMNSDVEPVGEFACSNKQFNQLHTAVQYTFLSNLFSVQSDCPAREKMGYGADMVATADAFLYNYNMAQFYTKTVNDFAAEQRPSGGITEIAPFTGIADRGYGDDSGPLGWELAFPYLQKKMYDYYGDTQIIADHYAAFKKQMDFLQSKAINGLFHWDIGDHEALDPRPEAFSASAFYYHHAVLAGEFAGILHNSADSLKYTKLATGIRAAIIKKYLVPGTGRFDNATQSAQLFALWYGLTPEAENSWQVLVKEFERHRWHLSTGIFSTKMLFDVTRLRDSNALAYTIANQPGYPGWLHMLTSGATTLWETWSYPELFPSQNHPMFGSVDEWFYRSLLGINAMAPGFAEIMIKPQPAGDLTWAKGSYHSVRGKIVSDWRKEESKFILYAEVPANVKAIICIPSLSGIVLEDGRPVKTNGYENGYALVKVGSGHYRFASMVEK